MQMVILCGGLATRLGGIAKDIPKSMIKIKDKPFLWYQIQNIKKSGIKDIVLCVGHLSEQIENYFKKGEKFDVNIKYSYDKDKPLGPIGALKKAEKILQNNFFIMYGDSYVFVDFKQLSEYFIKQKTDALMVVYKNYDKYDKSNIIVNENMVKQYAGDRTKYANYIDYGVSVFNKKILEKIPENVFYSTNDLFTNLVKKEKLFAYEVKNRFYHIGTPDALEEFKKFTEKNL